MGWFGKKKEERKKAERDFHNRKKQCLLVGHDKNGRMRRCTLMLGHWGKHSWER